MEEFRNKLSSCLLAKKEDILQKWNTIPVKHLEKTIENELDKQFEKFTKKDYVQLTHLDAIVIQIEHFQAYCEKEKLNPRYEDIDPISGTLLPKIELLNKLKTIVLNNQVPLDERIAMVKNDARKDSFYTILMTHDNHLRLDLKTLKRVFLNLFHSNFNFFGASYKPSDFYSSLDKVIKNEKAPKTSSFLQKVGFFSEESDEEDASKTTDDTLDSPAPINKP